MNLFIREDFISHAGLPLTWKVECDALSEGDYEALAKIVSEKIKFKDVVYLLLKQDYLFPVSHVSLFFFRFLLK